jgi:SutA-like transcriptional regulator
VSQKKLQRQRIRQQTEEFLARGGQVSNVNPGVSGQGDPNARRLHQQSFTPSGTSERTPVPEVVAAIEARKQAKRLRHAAKPKLRQPKRKLIYDDFGEPLRWEWVDSNGATEKQGAIDTNDSTD